MRHRGFTLIEMLAVIGIIALMSLLVLPSIINQVSQKKEALSEATRKIIFSATELYFADNIATYPKNKDVTYCVKLEELIKQGYLKSPLKDITTNKEIDINKFVKTTVNSYFEYDSYEILTACPV